MHSALSKRALALRVAGFVVATGLGAVGVWLIVTSDSQKSMRLGVLAGLWGLLLGTFVMFGARRSHEVVPEPEPVRAPSTELSRADDAAAQRAYEARLEHMLRREIQSSIAREVGELRSELASLRTELLDKVGGQIALERIETTRIIGSDLEALQREVRQLRERGATATAPPRPTEAPQPRPLDAPPPRTDERNRPVGRAVSTQIVDAEVIDDEVDDDAYRGRRRRDDVGSPELRIRRGRHSPEGEQLLERLLSRGPS